MASRHHRRPSKNTFKPDWKSSEHVNPYKKVVYGKCQSKRSPSHDKRCGGTLIIRAGHKTLV
eukprot:12924080-Prorocentrum_lima.AAC.1